MMRSIRAGAGTMTESELQNLILDAARWGGWLVFHDYDSRRSEPGFPDLVLVRGDRVMFLELKSAKGAVSAPQRVWLDALGMARCVTARVVRPGDADEVVAELAARRCDT